MHSPWTCHGGLHTHTALLFQVLSPLILFPLLTHFFLHPTFLLNYFIILLFLLCPALVDPCSPALQFFNLGLVWIPLYSQSLTTTCCTCWTLEIFAGSIYLCLPSKSAFLQKLCDSFNSAWDCCVQCANFSVTSHY
jgi:hypothetical protein